MSVETIDMKRIRQNEMIALRSVKGFSSFLGGS